MNILSFTSNAYRGRLFASYILSMPSLIRWGWEAIVSKFVSENTLRKIKITGEGSHNDMWSHCSRKTIEVQYGGDKPNSSPPFWPPNPRTLLFTDPAAEHQNDLATID